jgi:RimJ/RimL family protein N-acetyltransferase
MIEVVPFLDAAAFLDRAWSFLLADEARHTLPLGTAVALATQPATAPRSTSPPFFAIVEEDGQILAVATHYPPYSLLISPAVHVAESGSWPWLERLAAAVRETTPAPRGVQAPPAMAQAFAATWESDPDPPGRIALSMRIHELKAVRPLPEVPGSLRRGSVADRDRVIPWLEAMHEEAIPDDPPIDAERIVQVRLNEAGDPWLALYLWDQPDGTPVSICGASGPTPGAVRVNAVYTPLEHRRQGYATAAVAELSRRIVADGRRGVLFTDLANPTSNRIYARIGYEPVCDVVEWRFGRTES